MGADLGRRRARRADRDLAHACARARARTPRRGQCRQRRAGRRPSAAAARRRRASGQPERRARRPGGRHGRGGTRAAARGERQAGRDGGRVGAGRMTRVAVVTGAARGIGAATVRALAADGWAVVAVDRCRDDPRLPYALGTEAELRAVAAEPAADGRVTAVGAGAADPAGAAQAVGLAEDKHGALDAMIASAGVIAGGVPLWKVPREQEEAVIDVDLRAALTAARVAVPALLR